VPTLIGVIDFTCKWQVRLQGICGHVLGDEEALHNHVTTAHLSDLTKKEGYLCRWLGCRRVEKDPKAQTFPQRGKLERHMQTHTGCKCCGTLIIQLVPFNDLQTNAACVRYVT
jgi:hypothetical protein